MSPGWDHSGLVAVASSRVEPPRDSASLRLCWWQGWVAGGGREGREAWLMGQAQGKED